MKQQHFRDTRTGEIVTQFAVHEIQYFEKWTGPIETDCPCDVRCTSAIGPECNCACNGANHGIDHQAASGQAGLF